MYRVNRGCPHARYSLVEKMPCGGTYLVSQNMLLHLNNPLNDGRWDKNCVASDPQEDRIYYGAGEDNVSYINVVSADV